MTKTRFAKIIEIIGSYCYIGYLKASGTFATIATIPITIAAIYLSQKYNNLILPIFTILLTIISIPISSYLEKYYQEKDPHKVVIDEVVGYFVAILFFDLPNIVDINNLRFFAYFFVLSFLLFRFFDVVKVFPANISQKLPGGWGIVIDDIIAGIYTNIVLHFIILFI